jgi:hypothetical protein
MQTNNNDSGMEDLGIFAHKNKYHRHKNKYHHRHGYFCSYKQISSQAWIFFSEKHVIHHMHGYVGCEKYVGTSHARVFCSEKYVCTSQARVFCSEKYVCTSQALVFCSDKRGGRRGVSPPQPQWNQPRSRPPTDQNGREGQICKCTKETS